MAPTGFARRARFEEAPAAEAMRPNRPVRRRSVASIREANVSPATSRLAARPTKRKSTPPKATPRYPPGPERQMPGAGSLRTRSEARMAVKPATAGTSSALRPQPLGARPRRHEMPQATRNPART